MSEKFTFDKIRKIILDILTDIAPDEDLSNLKNEIPFVDQLELDSMDFLDIVMELRKREKIHVPEEDYKPVSYTHLTLPTIYSV